MGAIRGNFGSLELRCERHTSIARHVAEAEKWNIDSERQEKERTQLFEGVNAAGSGINCGSSCGSFHRKIT
jgi:hypothetical protein